MGHILCCILLHKNTDIGQNRAMKSLMHIFTGRSKQSSEPKTQLQIHREEKIRRLAKEYLASEKDYANLQTYKTGTRSLDFLTGLAKAEIPGQDANLWVPRYPHYNEGTPTVDLKSLIASQRPLINRIHQYMKLQSDEFLGLIVPLIWRYASLVHLLPASQGYHHHEPGGAFRHGLEVALNAMRGLVEIYLPTKSVAPRYSDHVEKQWHVAIFIAAIGHDLGKLLTDFTVVAGHSSDSEVWEPFAETLYDWSVRLGIKQYYIVWKEQRHQMHEGLNPLLFTQILMEEQIQWLRRYTLEPFNAMMSALSRPDPANNIVARLVLQADSRSTEEDKRARSQNRPTDQMLLEQPERVLINVIQRLWRTGEWRFNEIGGRLWANNDEWVYIVWEAAASDIITSMSKSWSGGILPDRSEDLADILITKNIARPFFFRDHEHQLHPILVKNPHKPKDKGTLFFTLRCDLKRLLGTVNAPSHREIELVTPDGDSLDSGPPTSPDAAIYDASHETPGASSEANSEASRPVKSEEAETHEPHHGSSPQITQGASSSDPGSSTELSSSAQSTRRNQPKPEPVNHQESTTDADSETKAPSEPPSRRPINTGKKVLSWPDKEFPFSALLQHEGNLYIPVATVMEGYGISDDPDKKREKMESLKRDGLIIPNPQQGVATSVVRIEEHQCFLLKEPLITQPNTQENGKVSGVASATGNGKHCQEKSKRNTARRASNRVVLDTPRTNVISRQDAAHQSASVSDVRDSRKSQHDLDEPRKRKIPDTPQSSPKPSLADVKQHYLTIKPKVYSIAKNLAAPDGKLPDDYASQILEQIRESDRGGISHSELRVAIMVDGEFVEMRGRDAYLIIGGKDGQK